MKNKEQKDLGQLPKQRDYWGKGFIIKGKRVYHPYTKNDFEINLSKGFD